MWLSARVVFCPPEKLKSETIAYEGESPHAENVATKSSNPFYFSLQRKFSLLDTYCSFCLNVARRDDIFRLVEISHNAISIMCMGTSCPLSPRAQGGLIGRQSEDIIF